MPSIVLAHILIWFLDLGQGTEVYLTLTTGCLGVALQSSAAHTIMIKLKYPLFLPLSAVYPIYRAQIRDGCKHTSTDILLQWERNHKRRWIFHVLKLERVDWKVILTWRGSKAWSRRGFFQCEALALHFAWADLCDCYKCSNSTVQFLVVGACVRARPLLFTITNEKNLFPSLPLASAAYYPKYLSLVATNRTSLLKYHISCLCRWYLMISKGKKPTTPGVPRRSPIQVLSRPDDA